MDSLALVFLLAVVVEQLVQLFKDIVNVIPFFPTKFKPLTMQLVSFGIGIILAYSTNVSAFKILGIEAKNPLIGIIITGLVIGKGSNFAHDFFHVYTAKKQNGNGKNSGSNNGDGK